MPKAYDPKPENEELFLRLREYDQAVLLSVVDKGGAVRETLAHITANGIYLCEGIPDREELARAGFAPNAIDTNGRLKVIGQTVEAEKCSVARYECSEDTRDALYLSDSGSGNLVFCAHDGSRKAGVKLDPATTRRLRDTLSAHLAYVEKEGLE